MARQRWLDRTIEAASREAAPDRRPMPWERGIPRAAAIARRTNVENGAAQAPRRPAPPARGAA